MGGEKGPFGCELAENVACGECGHVWTPLDTSAPGACGQCGSLSLSVQRCANCPLDDLDFVRGHSRAGWLFERALELEFDVNNFKVPWEEVTAEEVKALQILKSERDKYRLEQAKNPHGFQN